MQIDATGYGSFREATRQILAILQARMKTGVSLIGRIDGDEWLIVDTESEGGWAIAPGDVLDFSTTFCTRMLAGRGPRLAPDADAVIAYVEAPVKAELGIGAYVGVPLRLSDGSLYGTLCCLDHDQRPDLSSEDLAFVEAMARLLASEIERERARLRSEREQERLRLVAETDAMTGLSNRRAWDAAVASEQVRDTLDEPIVVVMADIDGLKRVNDTDGHAAGDELIRTFAAALRGSARSHDVVARLGGDEFGVLLIGTSATAAEAYVDRVRGDLARRSAHGEPSVQFTVGWAATLSSDRLPTTIEHADVVLIERKAARWSPTRSTASVA